MKKSKLSLCLASSFVVAMSLAACSSVTADDKAVVTIKNYDGTTVDVLSNSIYAKYKDTSDGVSKFYNAILESLIRYEYDNTNEKIKSWSKSIKSIKEIKDEAASNVGNDKKTAETNAKTNGTSYETEWNNILSSHNCEDEAELLQYYIYQLEKEDITDKFFLLNKDSTLTEQWLGVDDHGEAAESNVKGVFPYHIRHVLTKIDGGSTNFYDGTISQTEAKNLGEVMKAFISSETTFGDIAERFSEDTGSAAKYGDLGIMSTTTSFVNEFKLGIYAYDSIFTHKDQPNEAIKKGVGLDSDFYFQMRNSDGDIVASTAENAFGVHILGKIQEKAPEAKIQEVPYDAFIQIGENATVEKSKGKLVNNGNNHYYPRNVLYNFYLNFHNPFVITNEVLDSDSGLPKASDSSTSKFASFPELSATKKYLTDKDGNIIVGVRSEHGIHFMIMQKSIYEFCEGGNEKDTTSLEDYYTTLVPSDAEFPHNTKNEQKKTYVNYLTSSNASTYTTRANEVKDAIKSFDSTYDYRLFEYILSIEGTNVQIKDPELSKSIYEYISRTRTYNSVNSKKTLNEAWRTYAELVALQYESRTDWTGDPDGSKHTGDFTTIHPRCAIGFKNKGSSGTGEWASGGICSYEE